MMSVAAPGVPLLGGWASGTVGRMGEWVQKNKPPALSGTGGLPFRSDSERLSQGLLIFLGSE